jgi:hypothetical protein
MAGRTVGEDVAVELVGKTVIWGPSIAGAILLGPVGFLLGLAASVALVASEIDRSPGSSGNGRDSGGRT